MGRMCRQVVEWAELQQHLRNVTSLPFQINKPSNGPSPFYHSHGCIASFHTCMTEVIGASSGACSTMASDPVMQSTQPTMPNMFRRS